MVQNISGHDINIDITIYVAVEHFKVCVGFANGIKTCVNWFLKYKGKETLNKSCLFEVIFMILFQ